MIVSRRSRHDARLDRHAPRARRPHLRARRHRRAAPEAQAAPGDRVLLGAARARGRRARRRRARPHRRRARGSSTRTSPSPTSRARRTARRSSCSRSGTSDEIEIEDIRPRARAPPAPAAAPHHRLVEDRPRVERLLDRIEELYEKHAARISTAELNRFLGGAARGRAAAVRKGKRLNLLYGAQVSARPPRFRFS